MMKRLSTLLAIAAITSVCCERHRDYQPLTPTGRDAIPDDEQERRIATAEAKRARKAARKRDQQR